MPKYFFLLGADDPEMREIARVLMLNGQDFDYAIAKNGGRTTPGEAYYCLPPVASITATIVCVECQPEGFDENDYIKIDHHRPQDPGYSLGAAKYWEASSIGQVCGLLNVEPTPELRIIAAMDHCFAQALRGKCPEVTAWNVGKYYIKDIAEGRKLSVPEVGSLVIEWMTRMGDEKLITIASQDVVDCRSWNVGEGYSTEYLTSIAAASISGRAILLSTIDTSKRKKVVLCGDVRPETVAAFKEIAPKDFSLFDVYGVPVRGYAGGYLS